MKSLHLTAPTAYALLVAVAVAVFGCGGASRQGTAGATVGATQGSGTVASEDPVDRTDSTALSQSTADPDGYSPMRSTYDSYSHLPPLEAARALTDTFYGPGGGQPPGSGPARMRYPLPALHSELVARFLAEALESDPRSVEALFMRSELHAHSGRDVEAVEDLDRALALDPTYGVAYGRRASFNLNSNVPEAIADVLKAIEHGHDHSYMRGWLARAYDRQGRDAEAVEQYRIILKMQDVDPYWIKRATRYLDSQ